MLNYSGLATKIFGSFADANEKNFIFIKESLPQADIKIPYRTYLSMIFLTCTTVFLSSFLALVTSLRFFRLTLFLEIGYFIFVPIISAMSVFAILAFYPLQKSSSRRRNIETNLPFVLTHMGAVAESGIPPYIIFKLIGQFKEYGEIANEMKKIVRNIENFGSDPLTSVKEIAFRTPSDSFRQMLLGFVSTSESGGDVKLFLKNAGDQALFDWRIKRERFLQQVSAYAEFYTGLLIAAPLFMIALFAVMNMIQPQIAGYDILFLTRMSIYLVVPLLNTVFLIFLKGVEVEM